MNACLLLSVCECECMCSGHGAGIVRKPACVYVNTGMSMFILLVTVTVYTLVDCQLVNMGIVYFGESIKEEREIGAH